MPALGDRKPFEKFSREELHVLSEKCLPQRKFLFPRPWLIAYEDSAPIWHWKCFAGDMPCYQHCHAPQGLRSMLLGSDPQPVTHQPQALLQLRREMLPILEKERRHLDLPSISLTVSLENSTYCFSKILDYIVGRGVYAKHRSSDS